jgi:hypothetical protein
MSQTPARGQEHDAPVAGVAFQAETVERKRAAVWRDGSKHALRRTIAEGQVAMPGAVNVDDDDVRVAVAAVARIRSSRDGKPAENGASEHDDGYALAHVCRSVRPRCYESFRVS